MSRQSGLVLDLEKGLAVVLTPDGDYRRVTAGPGWQLGQEVQFESTAGVLPQGLRLSPAWLVAAVVLLALLVPGVLSVRTLLSQPALAAYVAVDINPSLELQVDAAGKVLEAQAVNDDALPLLQELALKGLPLDAAIRAITENAVSAGYLSASNDNMVLITVTPKAAGAAVPQLVQQHVAASQQAAEAVLRQKGLKNDVETLTAPAEVRDVARREGLPTGKLVVASEAARQGAVIDRNTLKSEPLTKAFEQAGNREALKKALEHIKDAKDKDALVKEAVDRFLSDMSREDGKDASGSGGAGSGGDKARPGSGGGGDQKRSDAGKPDEGRKPGGDERQDGRKDDRKSWSPDGAQPGSGTQPSQQRGNQDEQKKSSKKKFGPGSGEDRSSGTWTPNARWGNQLREFWDRLFGGGSVQDREGSTHSGEDATNARDGKRND